MTRSTHKITLLLLISIIQVHSTEHSWNNLHETTGNKNEIPDIIFEYNNNNLLKINSRQRSFGFPEPYQDANDFVFPQEFYPNNQQININQPVAREFLPFPINRPPSSWGWQPSNTPSPTTNRPISSTAVSRNENGEENSRKNCEMNCLSTNQYDPVCGNNFVTYFNEGKLRCAQKCGRNIRLFLRKPCPPMRNN